MKSLLNKIYPYVFLLGMVGAFSACDSLLDAENPNQLTEDSLSDPRAFNAMVNGAERTVMQAYANIGLPYSVVSDEVVWIGSRDAWAQLDFGSVDDINNEFTDAAWFFVTEARYWCDEVIKRGEAFERVTINANDLARAYLMGATISVIIADMYDDFVIASDKLEAGAPVGPGNMSSLYDKAIGYLEKANALKSGDFAILSMMARTHQAKGIWGKVNPVNTSSPLVASSAAVSFANQALAVSGGEDAYFKLVVEPTARPGGLAFASEINSRLEQRLSNVYIINDGPRVASPGDGDPYNTIKLYDPIDNIPDPALNRIVVDFATSFLDYDFIMSSTREMYLILAEDALANNKTDEFTNNINKLRALDGLTPYSGQIPALNLLKHARRVNLYLQGRRLSDHYRFNDPSPYWLAGRPTLTKPGTFFAITISEILANPNIN